MATDINRPTLRTMYAGVSHGSDPSTGSGAYPLQSLTLLRQRSGLF
jgi:hypothetical protein